MRVILCLDQGDRDVVLVVEDVIRALGFAARDEPAAHDDAALGEADLFADLRELVPARPLQRGRNKLGANVAFAQGVFVNHRTRIPWCLLMSLQITSSPHTRRIMHAVLARPESDVHLNVLVELAEDRNHPVKREPAKLGVARYGKIRSGKRLSTFRRRGSKARAH